MREKGSAVVLSIILTAILAVISISLFLLLTKSSPQIKQENKDDKLTYKNSYWGYEVKYSRNWFLWESESGYSVFIASYDGKDSNTWYVPTQNQLKIEIFVIPKDMGLNFNRANPDYLIKESEGPLINGEKSKEVYQKSPLSSYELAWQKKNNTPQFQIERGRYTLQYITRHNGFTFDIVMEPADSILIDDFKELSKSFKFVPRSPQYKPRTDKPPNKTYLYQNVRLGFSFEYSNDWFFSSIDDGIGALRKKEYANISDSYPYDVITVRLASKLNADAGIFEKDIVKFASLICAADGPNGSQFCPKESISLETFVNKYGEKGYKIHRTKIVKQFKLSGEETNETKEVLIVYKIETPDYFAILFSADDPKYEEQMLEIATSLKYLERVN